MYDGDENNLLSSKLCRYVNMRVHWLQPRGWSWYLAAHMISYSSSRDEDGIAAIAERVRQEPRSKGPERGLTHFLTLSRRPLAMSITNTLTSKQVHKYARRTIDQDDSVTLRIAIPLGPRSSKNLDQTWKQHA